METLLLLSEARESGGAVATCRLVCTRSCGSCRLCELGLASRSDSLAWLIVFAGVRVAVEERLGPCRRSSTLCSAARYDASSTQAALTGDSQLLVPDGVRRRLLPVAPLEGPAGGVFSAAAALLSSVRAPLRGDGELLEAHRVRGRLLPARLASGGVGGGGALMTSLSSRQR